MTGAQFDTIISKLDRMIKQCKTQKEKIDSVGGFENLTVKDANHMITDSKNFKINMDRVLSAELYHIIGMANLSAVQLQIFCSKIKTLCSYRYLIECLSVMRVNNFANNQNSVYNCKELGVVFSASGKVGETEIKVKKEN